MSVASLNESYYHEVKLGHRMKVKSCCSTHSTDASTRSPSQLPHVAASYAAVNALMCLGTPAAFDGINRPGLYAFLLSCKDRQSGGFRMHDDGEVDIRACYCALSIASLCNIMTPELCEGVPRYVRACQTVRRRFPLLFLSYLSSLCVEAAALCYYCFPALT